MCLENCANSKIQDLRYDPLDTNCIGFEMSDICDYIDVADTPDIKVDQTDLLIVQLNIRGLLSKQKDLSKLLFELMGKHKIDLVILCETWLTKESEGRVNIPGYTYYGNHRLYKRGGGVGFLISDEINFRAKPEYRTMHPHLEASFIELLFKGKNLIIGSLYRPPNTNLKDFINSYNALTNQILKNDHDLLIGLDHNLNLLNYENYADTQAFLEAIVDSEMFPCITRPTRITHQSATLIDNIILNKELYNNNFSGIIVSDISDHMPTLCILRDIRYIPGMHCKTYKRNLSEKRIIKITKLLGNIDLNLIASDTTCDLDQSVMNFHNRILDCIETVSPLCEIEQPIKPTHCEPWMSKGLRKCSKKQLKLYKKALSTKQLIDHEKYKQYRKVF